MATYTYDILAEGIEQGTIGQIDDETSSTRVRSSTYTELAEGIVTSVTISVSCSTSKTVRVAFRGYSSADKNSLVCNLYWYDSPHTFDLGSYSNIKYFRLVFKYSDDSDITPSELTSATLVESYRPAWQIENDIFTHGALPTMIPELVQPYPPGVWWIENDTFAHVLLPTMIPYLVQPYPPGVWWIENNTFKQSLLPESIISGAFAGCASLIQAVIPRTVESLGSQSFMNTGLLSVTISPNCSYFDTTFPEDCTVEFYSN